LLKIEPSKVKLLYWSFLPPNEPPEAEGSKRVKSEADLEIEGNFVNSLLPTLVSAPVLLLLKVEFTPPVITISSNCSLSPIN